MFVFGRRAKRSARLLLATLISSQMLLEPLAARAAFNPSVSTSQVQAHAQSHAPSYVQKLHRQSDPIWQEFVDTKPTGFKLSFSVKDPALDRDPYFMRSQSWVNVSKLSSELGFIKNQGLLDIAIPNSHRVLRLKLPLTPLQATDEFVFFSLDDTSDLFEKSAGPNQKPGEGIFFISRKDLVQQALDDKPVPVFFFPIGGSGWKGNLKSLELSQAETLVIANQQESESIAVELKDVETLMNALRMNLMMALSRTLKNRGSPESKVYPAPGMTAAFGLFFTGIDLENPEKSLWATRDLTWFEKVMVKVTSWMPLKGIENGIEKAHAFEFAPEVVDRLMYVGSVLSGMLVASVVIKYLHPAVRRKLENLRETPQVKGLAKWGRNIKETVHVFAAMSSTAAQIPSVTMGNTVEMFLDRFAPTVAAADHTLVRRMLNNYVYFARNSNKNVPVDAKAFVLGALVLNAVDSGMMPIQYTQAVPAIMDAVQPHVSEDMQAKIETTFDTANPETFKIIVQDTVRNVLSYLLSGAASYSLDSKQQVLDAATKEVEAQMQSKGLNPHDLKNQTTKENMINDIVEVVMKQKGLAGKKHFLFDMHTVYQSVPKALGYKTPEELQEKESFVLATRYGLSKNAVNRALKAAEEWAKMDSSKAAADAVSVLREVAGSMSFLVNGIKDGAEGLRKARQVRLQLTLLSYEGSIDSLIKYIPEAWSKQYSAEGAQAAALLFRQALYSYLVREGDELLMAREQKTKNFGEQARKNALAEIRTAYPDLASLSDEALQNHDKVSFELKLSTQIQIIDLARKKDVADKADKFTLPKQSWLERRKHRKAHQEAEEKVKVYIAASRGANFSDEQIMNLKKAYFAKALARQVGLHIENPDIFADLPEGKNRADYAQMLTVVEQKAQEMTAGQMKNDPNMARLLEKSSPEERAKIEMSLYANNYLQIYVSSSTRDEMVKPTDPAQPGRFQKIRQTQIVRNSAVLTRTLRVLESFASDQIVSAGLSGSLARNIPFYQDLVNAHKRLFKVMWMTLSVGYVWNYFAWQVHMPYASMLLFVATSAATIMTPGQWLDRAFRMQGIKPGGGILAKAAYGVPYTWATFLGMIPLLLFTGDVNVLYSDYVRDPFLSVFGTIPKEVWLAGAATAGVGLAGAKMKLKTNFAEKSQALKNLLSVKKGGAALGCHQVFQL